MIVAISRLIKLPNEWNSTDVLFIFLPGGGLSSSYEEDLTEE